MPSRRRQISATAAALPSVSAKSRSDAAGASTNSCTASTRATRRRVTRDCRRGAASDRTAEQPLAVDARALRGWWRGCAVRRRPRSRSSASAATRGQQVLAVVEHDQEHACSRRARRIAVRRSLPAASRTPSTPPTVRATRSPSDIGARSTNHVAVGKIAASCFGDANRQPRLAAAADAGQREQARLAEQAHAVGDLPLAADEVRPRPRQVVGARPPESAAAGLAVSLIASAIAAANCAVVAKRSCGCFARPRAMTRASAGGTAGRISVTGRASAVTCSRSRASAVGATKGGSPASISNSTQASE